MAGFWDGIDTRWQVLIYAHEDFTVYGNCFKCIFYVISFHCSQPIFLPAGIGGHGGSGIHADMQVKYNEIIQQVSKFAVPDLSRSDRSGSLNGSKNSNHSQSSLQSDSQLSTGGSHDHQVINDFFNDRVTPQPRRRASRQSEHSLQRPNQVEQVHVTKCAVCSIL
jgi:hypothetical protein